MKKQNQKWIIGVLAFVLVFLISNFAEGFWPMFQQNAGRTGQALVSGPAVSHDPKIEVLFEGGESDYFNTPVIDSENNIYCIAQDSKSGARKAGLYSLSQNGNLRWFYKFTRPYAGNSMPVISEPDRTIYALSYDGISAIDLDKGTLKWKKGISVFYTDYQPLISNGTVYFNAGVTLPDGGHDFCLISISKDGIVNWIYAYGKDKTYYDLDLPIESPTGSNSGGNILIPAVSKEGIIYFGKDNILFAFNADGTEKWRRVFEGEYRYFPGSRPYVMTPAVADDGTIYLIVKAMKDWQSMQDQGYIECLFALDPESPYREKWSRYGLGFDANYLTVSKEGNVYFPGGRAPVGTWYTYLYGIDSQGKDLPGWPPPTFSEGLRGDLLIIDEQENVYGAFGNYLRTYNKNGELQWSFYLLPNYRSKIISLDGNGNLYIGGYQKLYVVRKETSYPISCTLYNNSPRFSKPVQVNSVCADGSDVTLLKVSLPDSLDPNGIAMEIVNSGEIGEDGSIRITQRQTGKIEAIYTAPNNFCRSGHTEDAGLKNRPITIKVVYQGSEQSRFQFQLYRPPIVMLHGLWGDSFAWDNVINYLVQERNLYPQGLFWNHSYYSSNASSFEENKDVCDSAIQVGLSRARRLGYSAGKVDVIAHSMGGILARWYLHNLGTKHYQGDIHKFISIGVPHSGSQLADLAMAPGYYPVLRGIFGKFDKPIDKGAIDNLRVDSSVIDVILNGDIPPENIVPSHAITTTTVNLGEDDPTDYWWIRVLYEFFSMALRLDINLVPVAIFRESNDYGVALSSQRGGSLSTTNFEDILHTRQLKAGIVKEKIADLLNARLSLSDFSDFSMGGFHPIDLNFAIPFETAKLIETMKFAAETSETESVKIVSPAFGAVVDAGTVIDVKVQATGSIDRVLIAGKDMVYTKRTPPFDFSCSLPAEIIGPYNIVAVGFGANNVITTDSIQLQIRTSVQLVGFRTYPHSLLTVIEGEKADFRVLGEFSDGVSRDITSLENGTHYSIADTRIAVVVSDGVIQGVQTGETTLTISNGELATNLIVDVIEKSFYRTAVGLDWFFYE